MRVGPSIACRLAAKRRAARPDGEAHLAEMRRRSLESRLKSKSQKQKELTP
jgi:hypothetical protein